MQNLSDLQNNNLTNTSIWLETSNGTYNVVYYCFYTGSIHGCVCSNNNSIPVCDPGLSAVYSATGMICNRTCTFPEFNLSSNSTQCQMVPCTDFRVFMIQTSYACYKDYNCTFNLIMVNGVRTC